MNDAYFSSLKFLTASLVQWNLYYLNLQMVGGTYTYHFSGGGTIFDPDTSTNGIDFFESELGGVGFELQLGHYDLVGVIKDGVLHYVLNENHLYQPCTDEQELIMFNWIESWEAREYPWWREIVRCLSED